MRSFRSRVTAAGGIIEVDYQAPDRFHYIALDQEAISIGTAHYARHNGSWVAVDLPNYEIIQGFVTQPSIMPRWARLSQTVMLRTEKVDGVATHAYRYASFLKTASLVTTVWIGDRDHLPRRATYEADEVHNLVEYLEFNPKLRISVS